MATKTKIKIKADKEVTFFTGITNLTLWLKPEYYEIVSGGIRVPVPGLNVKFGSDGRLRVTDAEIISKLRKHPWFNASNKRRGFYEEELIKGE